jgi:hypothetical protein
MFVKQCDAAQVKTTVSEHVENSGVLADRTGHFDSRIGLVLRQVQPFRAKGKHRRSVACIEPPLVDLIRDFGKGWGFEFVLHSFFDFISRSGFIEH